MSHADDDIVAVRFEFNGAADDFRFVNLSLFAYQALLDNILADAHNLN